MVCPRASWFLSLIGRRPGAVTRRLRVDWGPSPPRDCQSKKVSPSTARAVFRSAGRTEDSTETTSKAPAVSMPGTRCGPRTPSCGPCVVRGPRDGGPFQSHPATVTRPVAACPNGASTARHRSDERLTGSPPGDEPPGPARVGLPSSVSSTPLLPPASHPNTARPPSPRERRGPRASVRHDPPRPATTPGRSPRPRPNRTRGAGRRAGSRSGEPDPPPVPSPPPPAPDGSRGSPSDPPRRRRRPPSTDGVYSGSATVMTGTGAERTVFSATLPSRIRSVPRLPVVPIPTASTSFDSMLSRITSTGVPCST